MRYVADKDGHWIPYQHESFDASPYVQDDIKQYGGRRKWREYLKRSGSVEMGYSDIKQATEKWNSRRQAHADSMKQRDPHIREAEAPPLDPQYDYRRSRLNSEIKNRLDGRAAPPLTTLV